MKKKLAAVCLCGFSLTLACGILTACGEGYVFPPFGYDYSEPAENFGDGIDIDGKLEESAWQDQNYLTANIKNTSVVYRMTSYYGEKGVYFGFEVEDDTVYFNKEREMWANSGVEFCVGSPLDTNITYEIDLTVGGDTQLRKYTGAPIPIGLTICTAPFTRTGKSIPLPVKGIRSSFIFPTASSVRTGKRWIVCS